MERSRWALVALVLLAVVIVLIVVAQAMGSRRRKATTAAADNEIDLRNGSHPPAHVDLRALTGARRNRFVEEWLAIQERYVDNPAQAVIDAGSLLSRVLAERGYPGDGEEHLDLVCDDHPRLAESLRAVSVVRHRAGGGLASTEDLQEAMVDYRLVFVDLLAEDDTISGRVHRDATARRN